MKTKMLSLLIAVPVAAFAVSAAIPGGDKDKTKKAALQAQQEQRQASQAQAQIEQVQATGSEAEANAPAPQPEMDDAQLASEMEKGMAYMEKQQNQLFDGIETWYWELSQPTEDLFEDKMLVPVRKAMNYDVDEEMFSRCPSGLRAKVYQLAEDKDSGEGFLTRARGCRMLPISRFRYDVSEKSITLWVSDDAGYVSVDKWVKAYKAYEKEHKANG